MPRSPCQGTGQPTDTSDMGPCLTAETSDISGRARPVPFCNGRDETVAGNPGRLVIPKQVSKQGSFSQQAPNHMMSVTVGSSFLFPFFPFSLVSLFSFPLSFST